MKTMIKKFFGMRKDVEISFYFTDFLFRKILRQNANVNWAVHFTSRIICPENIIKGKNVYPGDSPGNYIQAFNGITIGDYTNIGPHVSIISANHHFINNEEPVIAPPISIGKFCWIGSNAIILPSVELGDFTIVGAGSVVTQSFNEGYCVIAGNPAMVIKQLDKKECDQFSKSKL